MPSVETPSLRYTCLESGVLEPFWLVPEKLSWTAAAAVGTCGCLDTEWTIAWLHMTMKFVNLKQNEKTFAS